VNESPFDDRPLTSALRKLAADERNLRSSPAVEGRLLAQVRSMARTRRRTRFMGLAGASAVCVTIGVGWYAATRQAITTPPVAEPGSGVAVEETTDFFPLAYSGVPAAAAHVVRLQVPRSALASFGVAFGARDDASPTILADVVVGDDGLARAVRFVRVLGHDAQQEQQP
jgi:hypothetical protein